MDIKKLESFLTVVKHGSITSAAEELGYSQPGLTNMMNTLEDELGISLLIRGKSGVHLSPAGQDLFQEIRDFLEASKKFESAVHTVCEKHSTTLRVGAYSSIARQWLPSIMANYLSTAPDADMIASMQDIKKTYDAVRSESVDCALVSKIDNLMNGLVFTPLAKDELVAVVPKDKFVGLNIIDPKVLKDETFLMPTGGFDMEILPIFNDESLPSDIRYMNLDDDTIVSLVEHNIGVTIMSRLIMEYVNHDVSFIPLSPSAYRNLGIIVKDRKKNEASITNFINSSQETLKKL